MEHQTVIKDTNNATITINKVLYTGKVHITGGRDGSAKSDDERLNVQLTSPGRAGNGTNPEQLLAAGWSACFIGAMKHNASRLQIALPADLSVDTEIDLATADGGFFLQARLTVNLPGLTTDQAKTLIEEAHQTCPYSKVTRGNINVTIDANV